MALGKGLGALIAPNNIGNRKSIKKGILPQFNNEGKILNIPIASIKPDSNQPRKYFSVKELEELASSIKEHGILQPILVSQKADGNYELISGERRWRAAQIAELSQVPAIVKKLANQEKLEVALVENIQRENLNPLEEAFAYKRLAEEFGLTQQQIADKVGKARTTITNTIRLLELPEEVKEALSAKKISMSQARTLLSLADRSQQLDMLSSMLGEKITVRELEKTVNKKMVNKQSKKKDPNLAYLEDQLRTALGTKVSISQKAGRGRIAIEFYSNEELAELVDHLT